ncbi:hypothetical protein [Parashewanella curva]|nr:hypothetical protein [Parashewanella curva]
MQQQLTQQAVVDTPKIPDTPRPVHPTTKQLQDSSSQTEDSGIRKEVPFQTFQALQEKYVHTKEELSTTKSANTRLVTTLDQKDEQIAQLEQKMNALSVGGNSTQITAPDNQGHINITVNNPAAPTPPPAKPPEPVQLTPFEEKFLKSKVNIETIAGLMALYKNRWQDIGTHMPHVYPEDIELIESKLNGLVLNYSFSRAMDDLVTKWTRYEIKSYFDFFDIVIEATETDKTTVTNKLVNYMRKQGTIELARRFGGL